MSERSEESQRVAAALQAAGVNVESVFDLVNTSQPYPKAIPVLIELLPNVRDNWIKEGVVRALAVKEPAARVAIPVLIQELRLCPASNSLGWAIGNTLSILVDDRDFDEVSNLVIDPSLGKSRKMMVSALGNMRKSPGVVDILRRLLHDEEVAGHAVVALKQLALPNTVDILEPFLSHAKEWVRREARKAIDRIEKKTAKLRPERHSENQG